MTDTSWIKPGVEFVGRVARLQPSSSWPVIGDGWKAASIDPATIRPFPAPLSATAQRVVEAAMAARRAQIKAGIASTSAVENRNNTERLIAAMGELISATDAHIASLAPPPDALAVALDAARNAVAVIESLWPSGPESDRINPKMGRVWRELNAAIPILEKAMQERGT